MVSQDKKIKPQWLQKSLVGFFLGLTLAYVIIAIFAWYGPGGIDADVKVQFNMWILSPIWLSIIAFTYLFKTAGNAFKSLMFLNAFFLSLFFILKVIS